MSDRERKLDVIARDLSGGELNWYEAQALELEKNDVAWNMRAFGGSFVVKLGELLEYADSANTLKLKRAFPDYWRQYEGVDPLENPLRTFRCRACDRERLGEDISVYKIELTHPKGGLSGVNVNYCADDASCLAGAKKEAQALLELMQGYGWVVAGANQPDEDE